MERSDGRPRGLVGRSRELSTLADLLGKSGAGGPGVVEVAGDPGIGKTRLLVEFAARAERAGRLVLWGRAAEFERQVPFGIVTDALEDHLAAADPGRLAGLRGEDVGLLRAVFPALPVPPSGAAPPEPIEAERYRLYRAIRALLEAVAEPAGLVLVLDDLHWADDGSVELLDHLLRRPPRGRVLLVVAHRPRQAPSRLQHALARAVQDRVAELIEVGPLTKAEADELLPTGTAEARRRDLYSASGGNPFYLQALAGSGAWSTGTPGHDGLDRDGAIPAPVSAALAGELTALTPTQTLVAWAAAVAGDGVEPNLVAQTAGLGLEEVLATLDQLSDRDLVRPVRSSGRFRFRHPLVRRVTYEAAGAGWRLAAHARAAAALRDRGAPVVDQAHHVERSARSGDPQAIDVLREAATSTMHSAPATAAHWLEAALGLLPDDASFAPRRLEMLGMHARALGLTGRLQESRDSLHELLRLLPAELAEERAQLVSFCAGMERLLGRQAEARAQLLRELADLPDQDSPAALTLKLGLATGVVMRAEFGGETDWTREALATARRNSSRVMLADALAKSAVARQMYTTVDDCTRDWLDEAASLVDALSDGELAQSPEAFSAICWLLVGELALERLDDAIRHACRALQVARVNGLSHAVSHLLGSHGSMLALLGRLDEAADCFDDELDAALLTGSDALRSNALAHRCWVAALRGDLDEALRLGKEAVASAGGGEYLIVETVIGMPAQAHLYAGDTSTCLELLTGSGGGPDLPAVLPVLRSSWYEMLAEAEAAEGRPEAAAAWADRAQAHCTATGSPLSRRIGLAQLARVHGLLLCDPAAAIPHAQDAADSLTRGSDRVNAGRAHLLAGRALAGAGERDLARAEFARARALFEACGARLFLDRTVREERRMNARLTRRSRRADMGSTRAAAGGTPDAGLTERELQIAEFVGQGMTNRQIAELLHLSPKTVEVHLSHVYAKLGVSRRAAVAARLAQQAAGTREPDQI